MCNDPYDPLVRPLLVGRLVGWTVVSYFIIFLYLVVSHAKALLSFTLAHILDPPFPSHLQHVVSRHTCNSMWFPVTLAACFFPVTLAACGFATACFLDLLKTSLRKTVRQKSIFSFSLPLKGQTIKLSFPISQNPMWNLITQKQYCN